MWDNTHFHTPTLLHTSIHSRKKIGLNRTWNLGKGEGEWRLKEKESKIIWVSRIFASKIR